MNDFTKYTGRPGASRRGHWPIALLGLSLVSLLAVLLERTAAQQCPDFPEVGGNSRALAWDDGLQRRSWGVSTTEDGLTIYFDTHDPTTDLFRARRERIDEPFGAPEMLPPPVSGPDWEWFPRISPDGRWLYFAALRLGTIEIYASRAPFDQVIRLDQQVNRGVFSWPGCVTFDNTEFFFLTGWDLAVADFTAAIPTTRARGTSRTRSVFSITCSRVASRRNASTPRTSTTTVLSRSLTR